MATTQEKFEAAVNVIKNLPKDGPYQPSNDMKLRFYSLYKQATEGPCTFNKPAFWDVVGRVKWEAWRKLGDMTKDEAMLAYIEGLKEIVETMSYTDKIAEFMESVGPFYEIVELPMPKKSYDSDEDLSESSGRKPSGITACIISKNVGNVKQLEFILRSKVGNENELNENTIFGYGFKCNLGQARDNNVDHDMVNGDSGWSEDSAGFQENGIIPTRDAISDRFYSSNESDDEFSDPMDNDALGEEFVMNSTSESNGTLVHVDGDGTSLYKNGVKENNRNGPVNGIVNRGGGDPMAPTSSGRLYGGGASQRAAVQPLGVSGFSLEPSAPVRRAMGAGGGRGQGPRGGETLGDVSEQIAIALSQLQRDMESVLTRLNTLEALTVAHHNMAQGHLNVNNTGRLEPKSAGVPSWWPFKNMPVRAVAFFIAWPVIYHLFVKIISSSRVRRNNRR